MYCPLLFSAVQTVSDGLSLCFVSTSIPCMLLEVREAQPVSEDSKIAIGRIFTLHLTY